MLKTSVLLLLFILFRGTEARAAGAGDDGVIKILAIGNSFSADAIENSLFDLAKEKGIRAVVANLYIGGAPLTLHVRNARENKPAYSYRKTSVDATRTTDADISLEKALADEDWDFISFQQASPFSGQLKSVQESLPYLFEYVKERAKNPDVKFVYHQTWAYSEHSIQPAFANYDRDQQKMYRAIAGVSEQVAAVAPIDIVVPAGTAIQNARTSYIGDNFDRDGYHLRLSLGRYVAACTWFEKLFGIPVVGMKYKPDDVTEREKEVAQHAAHFAVLHPYEVTPLKKFRKGPKPVKTPRAAILVDFGGTSHEGAWNPVTSPLEGKVFALKDSLQNPTRIALKVTGRFHARGASSAGQPETAYRYPESVSKIYYFGQSKAEKQEDARPEARFIVSGLDRKRRYDIAFFSSHLSGLPGATETRVVCEGETREQDEVDVAAGASGPGRIRGIRPSADGTLTFTVTTGDRNTSGLYYLSALRLQQLEE